MPLFSSLLSFARDVVPGESQFAHGLMLPLLQGVPFDRMPSSADDVLIGRCFFGNWWRVTRRDQCGRGFPVLAAYRAAQCTWTYTAHNAIRLGRCGRLFATAVTATAGGRARSCGKALRKPGPASSASDNGNALPQVGAPGTWQQPHRCYPGSPRHDDAHDQVLPHVHPPSSIRLT
jgi:hypothetical protein